MSGLPLIVLAIVAVLSVGAQPKPAPPKGKVVNVEIIVAADAKVHAEACKGGGLSPTTVLVSGKEVHHCVDGELLNHAMEKSSPDKFNRTLVNVSAGDSVRWFSKANTFRVAQITLHNPIEKGAPPYPFMEPPLPTAFANEVTTPPVRDVPGEIRQQYKVSFDIDKPGNRVDPDVVCSM